MDSSSTSTSSVDPTTASNSNFKILRICKWCKKEYQTKRKLKSHKLKRHPQLLLDESQRKVQKVMIEIAKSSSRNQNNSAVDKTTESDSAITDNKQAGAGHGQARKKSTASASQSQQVKPTASVRPLESERYVDVPVQDEVIRVGEPKAPQSRDKTPPDRSSSSSLLVLHDGAIADAVKTMRDTVAAHNRKIIEATKIKTRLEHRVKSSVPVIKLKRAIILPTEEHNVDADDGPPGKVSKTESETISNSKHVAPDPGPNNLSTSPVPAPSDVHLPSTSEDDECVEEKCTATSNTGQICTEPESEPEPEPTVNLSPNGTKQCPICNQLLPFTSSQNKLRFREHVQIHYTLRPYLCPHYKVCRRSFADPVDLLAHTGFAHGMEDSFECDRCGTKFKLRQSLTCHLKKCNGACTTADRKTFGKPQEESLRKSDGGTPSTSAQCAKSMLKYQLAFSAGRTGSDKLARQASVEFSRGNKTCPPTSHQSCRRDPESPVPKVLKAPKSPETEKSFDAKNIYRFGQCRT